VIDRFYFRQWQSGRDFAKSNPLAVQMVNFAYAFGDHQSGDAFLVDPAYGPKELIDLVEADGLRVIGVIATHYHADHVGGSLMGQHHIDGIVELLQETDVPIHVHSDEVEWMMNRTGVGLGSLVSHGSGDRLKAGEIEATLIHTPGHSPGSQCILVEGHLLSGDTLFIEGCGRTDLPGSNPEEMYRTLNQRLSGLGDDVILYPGHRYSPSSNSPLGDVRETNFVLAPTSAEQWLAMFA
jgi:glyoxylase-like metal-dependent hydrolase (beta-lactamase superfamily II)